MEERLGYELKRTQQALRASMDQALEELGLTPPQYAALAALEDTPGVSSAELARRSFVTPQTMHAIVAGLERRGLLTRAPTPGSGRVLAAELSEDGRHAVGRAHGVVGGIEERMAAGLSEAERQQLLTLLRRCAQALRETARPPSSEPSTP